MNNHDTRTCARTYATLWICRDDLDPEAISRQLEIAATKGWKRGEFKNPHARRPVAASSGCWCLRTRESVGSHDVGRHIEWLLDRMESKRTVLVGLQAVGSTISISCFWESRPGHGTLTLAPTLMGRLADLALEVEFDVYFQAEGEADAPGAVTGPSGSRPVIPP